MCQVLWEEQVTTVTAEQDNIFNYSLVDVKSKTLLSEQSLLVPGGMNESESSTKW